MNLLKTLFLRDKGIDINGIPIGWIILLLVSGIFVIYSLGEFTLCFYHYEYNPNLFHETSVSVAQYCRSKTIFPFIPL